MADLGLGTTLAQLLGGGVSLYNALGTGGTTDIGRANTAAGMADPFASQRPQYQQMLANLYANPSSIRDTPGYQFGMGQGMDAIKGAGNAIYGGTRAGAIYPELAKFATGYADNAFHNRVGELSRLAGADAGSPGTAGTLYSRGGERADQDLGSGLNSLLSGLFGGAGTGGGDGIVGLLARYLTPSATGGSSGNFGMNDRGIGQSGALPSLDGFGGFGMNDRGIGGSGGAFDFGMGDRGVGQDVYLGGSPTFDEGALSGNGFDLGGSDWQDILGDFDWGNL